jgi:cation diffusion facilitator CzcD-associated flavoprotein CzcO
MVAACRIAVVGGGIAGLGFALALRSYLWHQVK